jgi:O-antigen/teichoic acid export membrane protein
MTGSPAIIGARRRRIARAPEAWEEVVAETTGLITAVALASMAVLLIIGGVWAWSKGGPSSLASFAAAGITCAAMQVQRYCTGIFRSFEWFGYENTARILQGATFVTLLVGLIGVWRASFLTVSIMFAVSHLLGALFLVRYLSRGWHLTAWRWDGS